jgi:hypothetical protein
LGLPTPAASAAAASEAAAASLRCVAVHTQKGWVVGYTKT